MTPTPPDDLPGVSRALDRLIDGELPLAEAQALQERMKADPAILSAYLDKMRMESLLRDHAWPHEEEETVARPRPTLWRAGGARRVGLIAAALAVLGGVAWLAWPDLAPMGGAGSALPELRFSAASLFDSTSAQPAPDGRVQWGDGVVMADGTVSIRLPGGVEAVLKSPSRFAITAANRLKLDEGAGWFRVPKEARGFSVDLPDMEVVDLGTVFTVQAVAGSQQVQVEEGLVEVRLRDGALPKQSLKQGQKLVRLAASGEVQITTGDSLMNPALAQEQAEILFQEALATVPDQSFASRAPLQGTWQVREGSPQIRQGRFAAQSSFTHLMGRFTRAVQPGENAVLLVSFKSVSPRTLFHSKGFAGISLFDGEGELLFFGDKSDNSYSWEVLTFGKNYRGPQEQRRAHDLSIQGSEETFTLRYRQRTGDFEVFRGWGAEGLPLVRGKTDANLRFDGVRVANGRGGDFSFEALQVSVVKDTTR